MHSSELFNEIDVGKMLESIGVELGPRRHFMLWPHVFVIHSCVPEIGSRLRAGAKNDLFAVPFGAYS